MAHATVPAMVHTVGTLTRKMQPRSANWALVVPRHETSHGLSMESTRDNCSHGVHRGVCHGRPGGIVYSMGDPRGMPWWSASK